jgi:uncharacterized cupredoxin-like copper-binding protein
MRSQSVFRALGWLLSLVLSGWALWGWEAAAIAAAKPLDPSRLPPVAVQVHLSNATNELKFFPDNIQFVAGKRYKLVLDNPSTDKHYFTAKDFADNLWSQKVEAGNVEIKGAIHELELKPGAIAEWLFVPMRTGTYELHCSIPGHTEAGMVGQLTIATK